MNNIIKLFLLLVFFHWNNSSIQAQNISLDFDGDYDFLSSNVNVSNNDFTIETWFLSADPSTSQNCIGNFKRLFSFSGLSTLELGICGGILNLYWIDDLGNIQGFITLSTTTYNNNNWHHIAISRTGQNIEVFLDCVSTGVYPVIAGLSFNNFRIGHWPGGFTPGEDWIGRVDDFRIWDYGKTLQEVIDEKSCVLTGSENDLQVYYNFDEGTSNGTNTGIPVVPDLSGGNDATFSPFVTSNPSIFGFELLPEPSPTFGNVSNYFNSNAPLAYPNLNNLDIEIRDYPYRNNLLTEICNGDPAHFTLLDNGIVPGPFSNIPVQWFYDDGAGPVSLTSPPFSDFRFG
ncbi:MAG: LamG domain-containing protein, partial [Saprospiraceae bacterium]